MRLRESAFWLENVIAVVILFCENDVVTEKSYQLLRSFVILRSGEGLTSYTKNKNVLIFLVQKITTKLSGCLFLENTWKKIEFNLVLVVFFVLKSNCLYFCPSIFYFINISFSQQKLSYNIHFNLVLKLFRWGMKSVNNDIDKQNPQSYLDLKVLSKRKVLSSAFFSQQALTS